MRLNMIPFFLLCDAYTCNQFASMAVLFSSCSIYGIGRKLLFFVLRRIGEEKWGKLGDADVTHFVRMRIDVELAGEAVKCIGK